MRYLRYLFLLVLGICLITVALANRQLVTLTLLPDDLAAFARFSWSLQVPLFLVVFGSIIVGLLLGFVWEWLREGKHRTEASRAKRDAVKLEREVNRLKRREAKAEGKDEVLALLEDGKAAG